MCGDTFRVALDLLALSRRASSLYAGLWEPKRARITHPTDTTHPKALVEFEPARCEQMWRPEHISQLKLEARRSHPSCSGSTKGLHLRPQSVCEHRVHHVELSEMGEHVAAQELKHSLATCVLKPVVREVQAAQPVPSLPFESSSEILDPSNRDVIVAQIDCFEVMGQKRDLEAKAQVINLSITEERASVGPCE